MIYLYGSTGYIGKAFVHHLRRRGIKFIALGKEHREFRGCWRALREAIERLRNMETSLVINCAAFITKPSVDLCNLHKSETLLGNTVFPSMLTNVCEGYGIPLMHVSTGCLYNGVTPMKESDPPQMSFDSGAGFYLGSKELAERIVSQYPRTWICRIRLPFDHLDDDRNYLSKLQRYPKVFSAQNSISHRGDFVNACLDMWEKQVPFGIYNVVNSGAIDAREICEMMRQTITPGKEYRFWDTDEFLSRCSVPKSNCILSVAKLLSTGVAMRNVHDAVEWSLKNWVPDKTICTTTTIGAGPVAVPS